MKVKVIETKHYHLENISSDMWKIPLTIAINLISFKDNNEERVLHSKCDYKEIKINDKSGEVIKKTF